MLEGSKICGESVSVSKCAQEQRGELAQPENPALMFSSIPASEAG